MMSSEVVLASTSLLVNLVGSSTKACWRSRIIFLRMVFFIERCRSRCFTSRSVIVLLLAASCRFFVFFTFRCDGADVDPAGGDCSDAVLLSSSEEHTEMALSVSVTPPLPLVLLLLP